MLIAVNAATITEDEAASDGTDSDSQQIGTAAKRSGIPEDTKTDF